MYTEAELNYNQYSKLIKKYGTEDNQIEFKKLCEYSINYKPKYILITLQDDNVAPYLTLKYINLLTEYAKHENLM
jgi:hypothetical protein